MNTEELFARLKAVGIKQLYIDTNYGTGKNEVHVECEMPDFEGTDSYQYRTQKQTLSSALGRILEIRDSILYKEEVVVPVLDRKLKIIKGKK